MDDNIEEKLKNLEEWNSERAIVKPLIDVAVDYHNRARTEMRWKNYDKAAHFYREAIKNYKDAVSKNPKYYLQDLLERIDHVISEYTHNIFILKTAGDKLRNEASIHEFTDFIDSLKEEKKRYIDSYDVALAYLSIGDFYYEKGNIERAYGFYNRVIETQCDRPFINRDVYFKIGKMQFDQMRFKEAVVSFVSVLSFDRGNREVIKYIEDCLNRLNISSHIERFLTATPNEAKKLIMEVL